MKFWTIVAAISLMLAMACAGDVMEPGNDWLAGLGMGAFCFTTISATLAAAARAPRAAK